jgi:hypothetical protein
MTDASSPDGVEVDVNATFVRRRFSEERDTSVGERLVGFPTIVGVEDERRLVAGLLADQRAFFLADGFHQPDTDRGLFRPTDVNRSIALLQFVVI